MLNLFTSIMISLFLSFIFFISFVFGKIFEMSLLFSYGFGILMVISWIYTIWKMKTDFKEEFSKNKINKELFTHDCLIYYHIGAFLFSLLYSGYIIVEAVRLLASRFANFSMLHIFEFSILIISWIITSYIKNKICKKSENNNDIY